MQSAGHSTPPGKCSPPREESLGAGVFKLPGSHRNWPRSLTPVEMHNMQMTVITFEQSVQSCTARFLQDHSGES